jgi:hypothetical protein
LTFSDCRRWLETVAPRVLAAFEGLSDDAAPSAVAEASGDELEEAELEAEEAMREQTRRRVVQT